MPSTQEVVDKFVLPWIQKNHPNAALVFLAGSHGRAMKNGDYQPVASSDLDLVIIYDNLEQANLPAASKIYTIEEVGKALGEDQPRNMMIDVNVHDFASLNYHDQVVYEGHNIVFINVMLDEAHILIDRDGIGPVLQRKAHDFLEKGPQAWSAARWVKETGDLQQILKDLKQSQSAEEKRFLGALSMVKLEDFALSLHGRWVMANQAYRAFDRLFPEEGKEITDAFSKLIRHGDSADAEDLLARYVSAGDKKSREAGATPPSLVLPVDQYLPKTLADEVRDTSLKFLTGHMCEALESNKKRGEMAYLGNISASLDLIIASLEADHGQSAGVGKSAVDFFGKHLPDMLPVCLQAIDDGDFSGVVRLAEDVHKARGGLGYTRLHNFYPEDLARVFAQHAKNPSKPKPVIKPGFTL